MSTLKQEHKMMSVLFILLRDFLFLLFIYLCGLFRLFFRKPKNDNENNIYLVSSN